MSAAPIADGWRVVLHAGAWLYRAGGQDCARVWTSNGTYVAEAWDPLNLNAGDRRTERAGFVVPNGAKKWAEEQAHQFLPTDGLIAVTITFKVRAPTDHGGPIAPFDAVQALAGAIEYLTETGNDTELIQSWAVSGTPYAEATW